MTIIPIFRREMVTAARQGKLQSERAYFAGQLLVVVAGSFGAWLYWSGGELDSPTMARVATEALRWGLLFHCSIFTAIAIRGARAIAQERDRRTLDFLLVTRMTAAEIVLGKIVACLLITFAALVAGLPVMLLTHIVGGVDARLILIAYLGLASSILFAGAMAVWVSVEVAEGRTALALFMLCMMAWMIGPFFLTVFLPRWGIRMPEWMAAANWWLVGSSPVSIAFRLATNLPSRSQLVEILVRMMSIQLAGAALFITAAILRLRPAHRVIVGVDRKPRRRLDWRLRPRPPVGDDPILWREKYTSREHALVKAVNWVIFGGLLIGLSAGTIFYARPAFVELWRYGFGSAATAAGDPEMNVLLRVFLPRPGSGAPLDQARMDLNLFIRYTTVAITLILSFLIGGIASEICGAERLKDTWSSLLATPLQPGDILRSAVLAAIWRSRVAFGAVVVLWTIGLAAGAIHPLGYLVSLLELAASAWMMAVLGVLGSIRAEKAEVAAGQGALLALGLTLSGVLPLLLPLGLNSVLWGSGSLPFMLWTSLVSYREVAAALASPFRANFHHWMGLLGGQRPMLIFASWLVAILGPGLIGLRAWRYTIRHFDRLVGRPHRAGSGIEVDVASPPPAPSIIRPATALSRRGSPLAEADGAV